MQKSEANFATLENSCALQNL